MNYHDRIMNIQATRVKEFRPQHVSYKEGHRDARHEAAEIALEAEREIEELKEMIDTLHDSLSSEEEYTNHLENILEGLTK